MYTVSKIVNGDTIDVASFGNYEQAKTEAISLSRTDPAPFVITRQGFGEPLLYTFRGRKLIGTQMVAALTEENPPEVIKPKPSVRRKPTETKVAEPPSEPEETKAKSKGPREFKRSNAFVEKVAISDDGTQGVVSAIVNVFGVIDDGDDIVHPGAFVKTLVEQGHRVRVLNGHQSKDLRDVVGRPLELREVGRHELPEAVLNRFPEATGGLLAETQFLLSDPTSKAIFDRLAAGWVDEWSIGFDPLDTDLSKVKSVDVDGVRKYVPLDPTDPETIAVKRSDGRPKVVRNIRTVRLWEYSPVVWGMNAATATVAVKDQDYETGPTEGKPWDAFEVEGKWCVYQVDEDGNRTGETLGCHATRQDALDQVAALYANTDEQFHKEFTPDGPQARLGDVLLAELSQVTNTLLSDWMKQGLIDSTEYNPLRAMCDMHIQQIRLGMVEDVALRPISTGFDLFDLMMFERVHDPDTKLGRLVQAVKDLTEPDMGTPVEESDQLDADTNEATQVGSSEESPTSEEEAGSNVDSGTLNVTLLNREIDMRLAEMEAGA